MTRRLLPPEEWPKLGDTPELGAVWQLLDPASTSVLVVEDGEKLVGCWAFITVLHAEGVYVDPGYRSNAGVARHLWRGMRECADSLKAAACWAAVDTPQIVALLEAHGAQKFPFDSYVLPTLKGES
jgi:hypothetical protein